MLTELGLTDEDELVYLRLLAEHRQTQAQLATTLHWPRSRLAKRLNALTEKGLVSATTDRPPRFSAISPDVAVESLCQQRIESARAARQAIPELMQRFWAAQRDAVDIDFIEIVTTQEGLQRTQQLQRAARRTVRGIDRPPYAQDPAVINTAELERIPAGVEYRAIYDQSIVDMAERWPDIQASIAAGEQARVLADIPFKVTLYDDWAAHLPVVSNAGEVAAMMIVHRSMLLDALSALFEAYWERAVPLNPAPQDTCDPESRQDRLITLLSAGLSDAAIRRTLGVSASTVQREIRDLMSHLGVVTRFQAGLQLGRRAAAGDGRRPLIG